jgi:hypothetical protein
MLFIFGTSASLDFRYLNDIENDQPPGNQVELCKKNNAEFKKNHLLFELEAMSF